MEIKDFFKRAESLRITVIGDLMLDHYVWGKVERISPEAPVPIVQFEREEYRLGGAANVAANLRALGVEVTLIGATGDDQAGVTLEALARQTQGLTASLFRDPNRPTTLKTRVIGAGRQQMLRIDREDASSGAYAGFVAEVLRKDALLARRTDAVVFEDYDKGFLTPETIAAAMGALPLDVPTFIDPKFRNFLAYRGATVFKPNLDEFNAALALKLKKDDLQAMEAGVRAFRDRAPCRAVLLTLGDAGMALFEAEGAPYYVPAHKRAVHDVSGAGDAVIAVLSAATAAGLDLRAATRLANLAGGLACEQIGVVPVDKARLQIEAERLGI